MREVIYSLCALTSLACAWLLIRAYRASRTRLLFWSSVCFCGLFVNNALLVVDELLTPADVSFIFYRDLTGFLSVTALLVGLIKDTK
jgi:hypothetical protein